MTNKEAMQHLLDIDRKLEDERSELIWLAVVALSKQISVKPQKHSKLKCIHKCRECGRIVFKRLGHDYCSSCGQAIDWSTENDK